MPGYRKGFKRSDKRWVDEQGQTWDSRFEWSIFTALQSAGYNLRRCDEGDTISYTTRVRGGNCVDCGGNSVVQKRTYNSDLYVMGDNTGDLEPGYLLELKGYWQAPKRTLFRSIAKQCVNESINLRIVFESNKALRGSKLTGPEYVRKYCKGVEPGYWDKKAREIVWI